jgi:bidirectional [NiFe] hydrogenase diaphorase subunit
MAKLWVDNSEIEVKDGIPLLEACLENGIYIPNLCYIQHTDNPSASCR